MRITKVRKSYYVALVEHCKKCPQFTSPGTDSVESTPGQIPKGGQYLARYLRKVQKTSSKQRQLAMGLETDEQYSDVIQSLLHSTSVGRRREGGAQTTDSPPLAMLLYLSKLSTQNSELQSAFSHLQTHLLIWYCFFLWKLGTPMEDLAPFVPGSRDREKRQMIRAIECLHSLFCDLCTLGWTFAEATELIFLGMCCA